MDERQLGDRLLFTPAGSTSSRNNATAVAVVSLKRRENCRWRHRTKCAANKRAKYDRKKKGKIQYEGGGGEGGITCLHTWSLCV